ncbi:MAG: Zn-dependent protease [Phycisphaerales bacterium]|nr:Zn-dependent protease [Phycisphaerales bacterium]
MTIAGTDYSCPQCAARVASTLLACPGCGWLAHSDRLQSLADAARRTTETGDHTGALSAWREALELLPQDSRQFEIIQEKIAASTRAVSAVPPAPGTPSTSDKSSPGKKAAAGLGALGLLLLKFKTVLLVLLTKGKLLLLGLTKASTFLSMLLSIGVYWTLWGWKFATGFVLTIYVHEMGHVIALRRYGIKASAPMFIPGLGALIRLQQHVEDPIVDAAVGLAGPIYGLGAALACLGIWCATRQPLFAALAGVTAWINLFNLTPIWQLDGGRAFHALSRAQKWLAAGVVAAAWGYTKLHADDGILLILLLVCIGRAVIDKNEGRGDTRTAITYVGLVIVLSALSLTRLYAPHHR